MANLPTIAAGIDMTTSEINKVQKFIENGLPGIADITNGDLTRMLSLYLEGSSFSQISRILHTKTIFVLYFAYTANWAELRQEYMNELQEGLKSRIIHSKLKNQEFMLLLSQTYQHKIKTQLLKFLATENIADLDEVSAKEVLMTMRIIEVINSLDNEGRDKNGKTPAIGLNMGANGVLVEKIGENQLSITPKDGDSLGNELSRLADNKRRMLTSNETKKESNDEEE